MYVLADHIYKNKATKSAGDYPVPHGFSLQKLQLTTAVEKADATNSQTRQESYLRKFAWRFYDSGCILLWLLFS